MNSLHHDVETTIAVAERRLVLWLFIFMACAFSIVQEGAITDYDGRTMYAVTRSVIERGTFAVSNEFNTLPGSDGRDYSRYGLGLSLLAAIPYIAARPVAAFSGHADHALEAAVSFVMAFVVAALVASLYLLARQLGSRPRAALLVSVGAVAGTFVLPYGKEFFSEPLTALCLVVAIERLLAGRSGAAGWAIGAAVLVRAQSALFAPVLVLAAWRTQGVRASLRAAGGVAPGVAATFAYNFVRFGDPLRFGYEDVGFTTPLLTGTIGLLFHPTKSLLLFAPISLLLPFALWRLWCVHRWAFVLIAGNLFMTFGTAAMWFAWHGGWCWGPRLLIPGLVPAVSAVGPWLDRSSRLRVAALLLAVGFAVSLPALVVPTQAQQLDGPPRSHEELWRGHYMRTQPLASPSVLRQLQLVIPTARYSVQHAYEGLDDGRNYLRYLSLWQVGATRVMRRTGLLVSLTITPLLFVLMLISGRRAGAAAKAIDRLDTNPRRVAGALNWFTGFQSRGWPDRPGERRSPPET